MQEVGSISGSATQAKRNFSHWLSVIVPLSGIPFPLGMFFFSSKSSFYSYRVGWKLYSCWPRDKSVLLNSSFFPQFVFPVWDSLTQLTVQEREQPSQDLTCFHGVTDAWYLWEKSLVDFLLSSSPGTCQGQADGKGRVSKDIYWFCFQSWYKYICFFNTNSLYWIALFCILIIEVTYIQMSSKYRKQKNVPTCTWETYFRFMHLVFYIMSLLVCSWLVSENFIWWLKSN